MDSAVEQDDLTEIHGRRLFLDVFAPLSQQP